jgi:hypothetical protein
MWTSSTSFRRVRYPVPGLAQAYTSGCMADKPPERKTNAKRRPDGVLGTLPKSRPERIGRPRATAQAAAPPKPAAVTPACAQLRASRATDAPPPRPIGAPRGTELVTTTIRAAGELAQVGLVVGGRLVKRTIDRLPRP